MTGSDVGNHFRDEKRIEFRAAFYIGKVSANFFFKSPYTTDTGSKYNSHPVFIYFFKV